ERMLRPAILRVAVGERLHALDILRAVADILEVDDLLQAGEEHRARLRRELAFDALVERGPGTDVALRTDDGALGLQRGGGRVGSGRTLGLGFARRFEPGAKSLQARGGAA